MTHAPRTLFEKIWDDHVVHQAEDGTCLLYIDRHLVHEGTSPQAFEGLKMAGRKVRRPDATLAVADHNVPTRNRASLADIKDEDSRLQIATLEENASATFAFWNQLTEARDFNGLRDVVPAGVQVARENTERAIAAGQEIYDRTIKTNEAIATIAKGEIEQVAAKAQAEAEKVVKTTAKKARR